MTPAAPAVPDAARGVAGAEDCERRRRRDADVGDKRTARREAAAGWRIGHVRHHALDGGQMRGAATEPRDRAEQADRVGMLRIGEQLIDRRALDDLAGIHHGDFVADLGDDAEIVGDQDDRRAFAASVRHQARI